MLLEYYIAFAALGSAAVGQPGCWPAGQLDDPSASSSTSLGKELPPSQIVVSDDVKSQGLAWSLTTLKTTTTLYDRRSQSDLPSADVDVSAAVTTGFACQPSFTRSGSAGPVTFKITNSMGGSMSISYQLGTYSTAGGEPTIASSLIGPSDTTGIFAKATTVVAPVGWAGRMTIGKAFGTLDYRGTKIEGNNGFGGGDVNADPRPDVDVSYVDGYSVPAVCSCVGIVLTGCNKELWDTGVECPDRAGSGENRVCVNHPRPYGPASPFFAPCAHAAYTYDYDDACSNWQGSCPGNTFECCIGTSCGKKGSQPVANNKRELLRLLDTPRHVDS